MSSRLLAVALAAASLHPSLTAQAALTRTVSSGRNAFVRHSL